MKLAAAVFLMKMCVWGVQNKPWEEAALILVGASWSHSSTAFFESYNLAQGIWDMDFSAYLKGQRKTMAIHIQSQ